MEENQSVRRQISWNLICEYNSLDEALKTDGKLWKRKEVRKNIKQTVYSFYCSGFGEDFVCDAKIKVYEIHEVHKFFVYKNDIEHHEQCLNTISMHNGIKHRDLVMQLHNKGIIKPYHICQELTSLNVSLSAQQVSRIIYRNKRRNAETTLPNLFKLCDLLISESRNVYIARELSRQNPMILLSHRDLLLNSKLAVNLHIDGTYKLVDLGFPVIVMGTSDTKGSFHLLAIAIVGEESSESYSWCMNQVFNFYAKLNIMFYPVHVIADAAPQITRAQKDIFPEALRITCWAHVWRNMSKLINSLPKAFQDELASDIHFLQRSRDRSVFIKAVDLLKQKWSNFNSVNQTVVRLVALYCTEDSFSWFEGFSIFAPSTNNALERFNRTIKDKYVNWNRSNLTDFIRVAKEIICDQANISNQKALFNPFSSMEYDKAEYMNISGFNLKLLDSQDNKQRYATIPLEELGNDNSNILLSLKTSSFESLAQMRAILDKYSIVSVEIPLNSYKNVTCSCYTFLKHKRCSHVYKYLADQKKLDIVEVTLLRAKAKRGRRKKIGKNTSLNKA